MTQYQTAEQIVLWSIALAGWGIVLWLSFHILRFVYNCLVLFFRVVSFPVGILFAVIKLPFYIYKHREELKKTFKIFFPSDTAIQKN